MDIRQIQALHAQYSPQPVVIDIAHHEAAMPALPPPERSAGREWKFNGMPTKLRKAGRPALLCVAIAALAGGTGMSAAKIWRVMHDSVAAPVEQITTTSAPAPAASESAINAAPARPLTASDSGQHAATTSALASVDVRSLSIDAPKAGSSSGKPSAIDSTLARAAASPIHAQRPAVAVQPAVEPTITPALAATATQPATVAPAAPVTAPAIARASSTAEASAARPALHPIRHVTSHHTATTAPEASATPSVAPRPAPANAPAAKGGDVQLF